MVRLRYATGESGLSSYVCESLETRTLLAGDPVLVLVEQALELPRSLPRSPT